MHLVYGDKQYLFIAANPSSIDFVEKINKQNFQKLLINVYQPSGRGMNSEKQKEGKTRSERYASKLKTRIFDGHLTINSDCSKDEEKAIALSNILREKDIISLKIKYSNNKLSECSKIALEKIYRGDDKKIFFICVDSDNKYIKEDRHAEEFLCDIVEFFKFREEPPKQPIYTSIAGKKRPCIGCSGRMESTGISNYGKFPGKFWLHTMENQPKEVAIKTVEKLVVNPTHVSFCKSKKSLMADYDSGSDSEGEKLQKRITFNSSSRIS